MAKSNGIAIALNIQYAVKLSSNNENKALVTPQVGQGTPKRKSIGQVILRSLKSKRKKHNIKK